MARIFISPSTQEHNAYAGGGNEEDIMRRLSTKVCTHLVAAGHKVKMGSTVSAAQSAKDSNAFGARWHIAVHSNAGGGSGAETWHHPNSPNGKRMAVSIYKQLSPATSVPDRGVKSSSKYIELNATRAAAVIVEVLFHDKLKEAKEIKASLDEFALAIAQGIVDVAGGTIPTAKPAQKPVVSPAPPKFTMPDVAKGLPIATPKPIGFKWSVTEQGTDRIVLNRLPYNQ